MLYSPDLRNHQGEMSRQCSSNASDGTCRERGVGERESSLEDSGVVDDHEEGEGATEEAVPSPNIHVRITMHSLNIAADDKPKYWPLNVFL